MDVVQLQLALADQAEAITQVALAGADRFHLRTQQLNAAFERFENLVLMAGEAVVRHQLVGGILRFGAALPAGALGHGV